MFRHALASLLRDVYCLKPGSHLCDKHNTSDISTTISTRKKEHVPFFLCLCLCLSLVLCLSHKCEPGLKHSEDLIEKIISPVIFDTDHSFKR